MDDELYEIRYWWGDIDNQRGHQIGSLIRFSSYISLLTSINLFRGINMVHRVLGGQSIAYIDTDSIIVDL